MHTSYCDAYFDATYLAARQETEEFSLHYLTSTKGKI